MSFLRKKKVQNGDRFVSVLWYRCNGCGSEIFEGDGLTRSDDDNTHFCHDCSFRLGLIDGKTYSQLCGLHIQGITAVFLPDGKIIHTYIKTLSSALKKRNLTKAKRLAILERDKFRCVYCGVTADQARLHIDHVLPKSLGGSDDDENLVTACEECNQGKSDRLLKSSLGDFL